MGLPPWTFGHDLRVVLCDPKFTRGDFSYTQYATGWHLLPCRIWIGGGAPTSRALRISIHRQGLPDGCPVGPTGTGSRSENGLPVVQASNKVWQQSIAGTPSADAVFESARQKERMKHAGRAIRDAAEKGGYGYRWWKANDLEDNEGYNALPMRALTEHLQDPEFWKGLGRARDWQDTGAWLFHWHRFIDHIAFGNEVESFFSRL